MLALWNTAKQVEPSSIPQALSSADPFHIVLYCPLPCFDTGYVLACVSMSWDMDLKLDVHCVSVLVMTHSCIVN